MSNIAWFFKKHLINKYLLVHIRNLIFITRCFVDRKFSIIATITISDDTMDGLLWLLLNHFWGNVYFLCIRLLTKWFTVDLTHFYFCLINNKQNEDKRWRAKRKWKSSTGNFLDMTEQSCQKYHRGITKRFLLKKCCRCRLKSIEAGMRERSHIWPFVNFKLITVDWVKKEPPHCLFLRRFFFQLLQKVLNF